MYTYKKNISKWYAVPLGDRSIAVNLWWHKSRVVLGAPGDRGNELKPKDPMFAPGFNKPNEARSVLGGTTGPG